ncbi:hypothetical protein [Nocardia sp. NPDC057227]|uniref:hypothetical protein n=1 Tax=Nocardia sp. NPDC057227 TaxID=3346056 RepID=UPI00362E29E0
MTDLDWFSHTATIPPAARQKVAGHLAGYVRTVRDQARRHLGEHASVCVSGSLARGEPALRRTGTDYRLGSDADLVAICDGHDELGQVERFTRAVLAAHPDIDSTVFTVARQDLGRVTGRFGADLHHAAARPLAGPIPVGLANSRIGLREGMEGLTHQLARIYCPDHPPGASPWQTKTALEALRALTCSGGQPRGPQRYSSLITDRRASAVLGSAEVAALVGAREQSHPMPLAPAHTYELVLTAAAHLFGTAATHPALLTGLHTVPAGIHLLDGFQRAILAATFILYGPPRFRCAAAAALHVTLTAIDRDTVPTALADLDALAAISPSEFGRCTGHPDRVLRARLQRLRADYYHHLGPHNFGACPVTTYTGPTSTASSTGSTHRHG